MARLIDADALLINAVAISNSKGQVTWSAVPTTDILTAPTAEAVMVSDLRAWLYEIAMNNSGEKFDGDFSDAVEEIINRLDGLRVFAEERRTDG